MKYITPSTTFGFIFIAVFSVIADSLTFSLLEGSNTQAKITVIVIVELFIIAGVYLVCFKYMKSKLERLSHAIINKDLSSLQKFSEHEDETSKLSDHLQSLIIADKLDKIHLELDDLVSSTSLHEAKQSLHQILTTIALKIEDISQDIHCSILLLNEERTQLHNGASPSLPPAYVEAIDGVGIGKNIGSCGHTAFTGEPTIVSDIYNHSNWAPFIEAVKLTEFKACWSYPLKSSAKETIGTFAIYYKDVKEPSQIDKQIIKSSASMTSLIIERFNNKKHLIHAKETAEKASQIKSDFLSNMSHEFRTPLNAILGFAQIIEMSSNEDMATNYSKEIMTAGDHLLQLINDILSLAKIEAGKMPLDIEDVFLNKVIDESILLLESQAYDHKVHFVNTIPAEDKLFALVDYTRVKQVIINLLSNAIKYNKKDGNITISYEINEQFITIFIKDQGLGLTAEEQEIIFKPFERSKAKNSSIEGTGIGLTITEKLLESMNGSIGVNSTKGEGSQFWFKIPVGEELEDSEVPLLHDTLHDSTDKVLEKHILYVEDNPTNMSLMRSIITEKTNYVLLEASDAEEGFAMAKTHLPQLILLDINLPDVDGFEFSQRIQKDSHLKHTPIIAVTALAMDDSKEKAKDLGFVDYITKPINVIQLLKAIDSVLKL